MPREILTNPTESELTACVHENLYALFRAMDFLPGYASREKEPLSCHHAFPANPMFKGVWQVRLEEDEIEDAVAEAVAWFEERNAASFFWWIDPETTPLGLTRRLLARGFDGNPEGDPGMVADLKRVQEDVRAPKGFRLLPAADEQTMAHWRPLKRFSRHCLRNSRSTVRTGIQLCSVWRADSQPTESWVAGWASTFDRVSFGPMLSLTPPVPAPVSRCGRLSATTNWAWRLK